MCRPDTHAFPCLSGDLGVLMNEESKGEIIIYRAEDGETRLEVSLKEDTVWLSQAQMCQLFDKNKRTVSEHIRNIFKEGELHKTPVVRKFRTTARDGKKGKKLL